ncbi:MAG TPA: AmmeMemoRadiSam system radical SAM enzyme [Clostridiaceae bacterium]|nr:AmmeMemoRadiSam system radical SAM enzyme [Clostridiaceae bacterium]
MNDRVTCQLCPHYCKLSEGQIGFCGARQADSGKIISLNYGKITSLALDPIEKKPLAYYHPGSMILSAGSFGCNMACPFCQNYSIATSKREQVRIQDITPEELIELAQVEKARGNIGIAFTYNEPLIAFDFILDTAKLAQTEDLKIIIVSNGQINQPYLEQLLPYVSAWNIDLKSFSETGYRKLGGDLKTVLKTIELTQAVAHVEVTTLVVPGISDDQEEMRAQAKYLASLNPNLPLHLSRYFPCYKYTEPATDKMIIRELKKIAEQYLNRVRLGNM